MSTEKKASNTTAAILSFFIPGAGQMYKDQVLTGMAWMVVVAVGYAFMIIPGLVLHFICVSHAAYSEDDNKEAALGKMITELKKGYELRSRDLISESDFNNLKNEALSKFKKSGAKPAVNDFLLEVVPLLDSGALSKEEVEVIKSEISQAA